MSVEFCVFNNEDLLQTRYRNSPINISILFRIVNHYIARFEYNLEVLLVEALSVVDFFVFYPLHQVTFDLVFIKVEIARLEFNVAVDVCFD